jgi:hypothetical protein
VRQSLYAEIVMGFAEQGKTFRLSRVTVCGLLSPLPVPRRDFQRHTPSWSSMDLPNYVHATKADHAC